MRHTCEILLTASDGMDVVMGPYLWVAMDGPDIRAMCVPNVASEIVLRKIGRDWRRPGAATLWEDVTIRATLSQAGH